MKTSTFIQTLFFAGVAVLASVMSSLASAQPAARPNPTGKLYVAEVEGSVSVRNRDKIENLAKKTVHDAEGASLTTSSGGTAAVVLSNGVGLALDPATNVEIKRFVQEPFWPNRTDLESEPSVSHTSLLVTQGTLSLYTGKLSPGSTFNVSSPFGSVAIRGLRVSVEVNDNRMIVSLIEGDATARGAATVAGLSIPAGKRAIITRDPDGGPSSVVIEDIPAESRPQVENRINLAEMARKTVFFDSSRNDGGEETITAVEVLPGRLGPQQTISPFNLP